MASWQLQDAKARLSELVKKAVSDGPQHITLHGAPAVVVLSEADYRRLQQPGERFLDFMRRSPMRGVELKLVRDRRPPRDVKV